jgi:signal transduction histidine kinase
MKANEQTTTTEGMPPSSINKIVHELANSANTISSTVQLLERDLKDQQGLPKELIRELITILKDECSRMEIQIEELRQLAKKA